MQITNEDNDEFLEITEAQFSELMQLVAINTQGYWLLDENAWTILAIGLDQEPGGFDLIFEAETRLN